MSVITSSNRSRAEWSAYLDRNTRTSVDRFMSERPHSPAEVHDAIARSEIKPERHPVASNPAITVEGFAMLAHAVQHEWVATGIDQGESFSLALGITHAGSFGHVIAVDECGAPILSPSAPDLCENV